MTSPTTIRPRERNAVIQSLRAGVVPRAGQQHIQVGRNEEVLALVRDIDRMAEGSSSIRFVVGEYGAGKTFFLNLIRSIALEKRFVTVHADLAPDRRLHATGGQARSLCAEMMRNIATRSKPEGGAMASVVERFVTKALEEARQSGVQPDDVIRSRLTELSELKGGYDFANVIAAYWRGHDTGNEQLKSDAVRWLRAEFTAKTDARTALGVREFVDDANVYDHLKLMSLFTRLAGYSGLLVCLDELVNLYKLSSTQARNANYEQILRILNDTLQGSSSHLGFLLGGTPEFVFDTRRGLHSYPALQSRLAENRFAVDGLTDYSGPVLRLASLTAEDFYVLLTKVRHVYASGDDEAYLVPDEALSAFMAYCSSHVGDTYFRTPRTTVKAFCDLLAVLEQHPDADWNTQLRTVDFLPDTNPDLAPLDDETHETRTGGNDDGLASFRL